MFGIVSDMHVERGPVDQLFASGSRGYLAAERAKLIAAHLGAGLSASEKEALQ